MWDKRQTKTTTTSATTATAGFKSKKGRRKEENCVDLVRASTEGCDIQEDENRSLPTKSSALMSAQSNNVLLYLVLLSLPHSLVLFSVLIIKQNVENVDGKLKNKKATTTDDD